MEAISYWEVPWADSSAGGYYGSTTATHALKIGQFSIAASRLEDGNFFMFEGILRFESNAGVVEFDDGIIGFPECLSCSDACIADLDGDGNVGGSDITMLLAQWGEPSDADLDGSGTIDGPDLTIILGNWGSCSDYP